jgi:thioredoxin-like negative regulator of GroEL
MGNQCWRILNSRAAMIPRCGSVSLLAFENESVAEQEWLERTFAMLNDTLRNIQYYQKILKEGREEELQRELQRRREALVDIVLDRFPQMVRLFKKQADTIGDPSLLLRLIVKISTAQSSEEAEQHLLTILRAASGDEDEQA